MVCSEKELRAIRRRSLGRGRTSNWRRVFFWSNRKGPHSPKRKLRAISQFVGRLSHSQIRHVIERSFPNMTGTGTRRRFFLRGNRRRTNGNNWTVTNRSGNKETIVNSIGLACSRSLSSSPSYSLTEWDALSSSSRTVSPVAPETGKPKVEGATESNTKVAPKKDAPRKTGITQLSEKPEVEVEIRMSVDRKNYSPRKAGVKERLVNQLREKPEADVETEPTVKLGNIKSECPNDSISDHPVTQSNRKPDIQAETKMTVVVDRKKCSPRKTGIEKLSEAEIKMAFKLDPTKCVPQKAGNKELSVPQLCKKTEVNAESESTVELNPPRKGVSEQPVTQLRRKPKAEADTNFSVELDPRKYCTKDANEFFLSRLKKKPEVESETDLTVQMDRETCAPPKAGINEHSTTQLDGKPIFELDPKKYVPSKANVSDPSVTQIDVEDCCVVYEKIDSLVQTSAVDDLIKTALEKEKKMIQEKNVSGSSTSENSCPLIAKTWKNFTARVDNTTTKKPDCSIDEDKTVFVEEEIHEINTEQTEEKTCGSLDSSTLEKRVNDMEEIEQMDVEKGAQVCSLSEVPDFECLDEDSDASSVVRELPAVFSPQESEGTRCSANGSTFEEDSERDLPAIIPTKEDFVDEEMKEKREVREEVATTAKQMSAAQDTKQAGGDAVIEEAPVTEVDESEIPVGEDQRPVMVDAEMYTTSRVGKRRRCHCRTTNFKLRRLSRKVMYMKKLMLIRTRTFKADRDAFAGLLKDNSKVMKSVLRMLRSQASLNERLIVTERRLEVTEKQSSSTQTELVSEVGEASAQSPSTPASPVREVISPTSSVSRRLFLGDAKAEKRTKRKTKKLLSLSQPCNPVIPTAWDAIRQKAAEFGRQKRSSSMEEVPVCETKDTREELLSRTPDDSVADMSLDNGGSAAILSSLEEETKTAQALQAVYEEVKADEEIEEENKPAEEENKPAEEENIPKKRKRIRFQLDENEIGASQTERIEIGASQSERINGGVETFSPLKDDRPGNRGRVKSKPQETPSSPEDDSWNDYIKDLVGRLAQDFSANESQNIERRSQKNTFHIEFQNEDILSYLFLDEQFVFTTRKVDPAFKEISHDDAALARIVSQLRASGDIDAAEKAIYAAGILDCANFDNIRKQLRQYLKIFVPSLCFYFQVHLDIQTGDEELRVIVTEARCRDDWIDGLEGYKVSVKSHTLGSLPKLVGDDSKEEEDKTAAVVGPASFISQDSCPNVKFVSLDRHTVGVVAIRDIIPGEELFIAHGIGFNCKKKKVNHPRTTKEKARYDRSF